MNTRDLINKQYGVDTFDVDDPIGVTSVTQSPTRILDNNPNCLQVTIVNTGSNDINIWTDPSVSSTKGIRLVAGGGAYEVDFTRFGTFPTKEWWAIGVAGSSTVSCKRLVIN